MTRRLLARSRCLSSICSMRSADAQATLALWRGLRPIHPSAPATAPPTSFPASVIEQAPCRCRRGVRRVTYIPVVDAEDEILSIVAGAQVSGRDPADEFLSAKQIENDLQR